jgi:hypothetical protein
MRLIMEDGREVANIDALPKNAKSKYLEIATVQGRYIAIAWRSKLPTGHLRDGHTLIYFR